MSDPYYESDRIVAEYLLFHYAREEYFLEQGIGPKEALGFAKRCGQLGRQFSNATTKALDLGCAVGGASFELSAHFGEVVGVDFSKSLIESAQTMACKGALTIPMTTEGELSQDIEIRLPSIASAQRVHFEQGDAMDLDPRLRKFDFILMANLIDRLPDPRKCIEQIIERLTPDGVLAITSPYTWIENFTPKEKWLGGFMRDGLEIHSRDTLHEIFAGKLELVERIDMPFLIREHSRKNQFSVAEATIWQKTY